MSSLRNFLLKCPYCGYMNNPSVAQTCSTCGNVVVQRPTASRFSDPRQSAAGFTQGGSSSFLPAGLSSSIPNNNTNLFGAPMTEPSLSPVPHSLLLEPHEGGGGGGGPSASVVFSDAPRQGHLSSSRGAPLAPGSASGSAWGEEQQHRRSTAFDETTTSDGMTGGGRGRPTKSVASTDSTAPPPSLLSQWQTRPQQPPSNSSAAGTSRPTNSVAQQINDKMQRLFPLLAADENGKFTSGQVEELLRVIEASQRYGKEIEESVQELAELLRQKTIECDGLRKLAKEKLDPIRSAVKGEYDHRVAQEQKHGQELRRLQGIIEQLKEERTKLRTEISELQALLKELQSVPPKVNYDPYQDTVLNEMLRAGDPKGKMLASAGPTTWNLPNAAMSKALAGDQKEFLSQLMGLSAADAEVLENTGAFSFMKALARRLCLRANEGVVGASELGVIAGEMIRDLAANQRDFAQEAAMPIPGVKKSWRQKVTELYFANWPRDTVRLPGLLERYEGREEELFHKLQSEAASNAAAMSFSTMDRHSSSSPDAITMAANGGGSFNAAANAKLGASLATSPSFSIDALNGSLSRPITTTNGPRSVDDKEVHARCIIMYQKYCPEKVHSQDVADMMLKYPPDVMLAALIDKYGPEPSVSERKALIKQLMESVEDR